MEAEAAGGDERSSETELSLAAAAVNCGRMVEGSLKKPSSETWADKRPVKTKPSRYAAIVIALRLAGRGLTSTSPDGLRWVDVREAGHSDTSRPRGPSCSMVCAASSLWCNGLTKRRQLG